MADDLWEWTRPGEESELQETPFADLAARVHRLRALLSASGLSTLEVRPLVVLAPPAGKAIRLRKPVKRGDLASLSPVDGLAEASVILLADPSGPPVTGDLARRLADALPSIGVHPISQGDVVGGYRLGTLLAEHDTWQEHAAIALADPTRTARIRT